MVSKKLQKRPFLRRTAANALHPHPSDAHSATHPSHPGFFIKDELSDHRFLVDTGAFRSILPPSRDNNPTLQPSSAALVAANGTSIQTYGEQEVNIRLSGQTYSWTFIIADVRHPLLGADFLSHYSLVVDVARHRLLNTYLSASLTLKRTSTCSLQMTHIVTLSMTLRMSSNQSYAYPQEPLLSMSSNTTSRQMVRLCTQGIDASDLSCTKSLKMHSQKWRRWVCVQKLPVPGLHLYI